MADNEKIVLSKLVKVQQKLKAPKGQYNSFAKYNYRSCEDILEAVKPLAHMEDCVVMLHDELTEIAGRLFIKATASIQDSASGQIISQSAFAELDDTHKGMSAEQKTGSCSSYARKYALNGLFAIDDAKDADTDEHHKQTTKDTPKQKPADKSVTATKPAEDNLITPEQNKKLWALAGELGMSEDGVHMVFRKTGKKSVKDLTKEEASKVIEWMQDKKNQKGEQA